MSYEHLIKWGKDAFEKGFSLANIEKYLIKRGLKQHEALKALHEITSFEHRIQSEIKAIRKELIILLILLLLIISSVAVLYFVGILKVK